MGADPSSEAGERALPGTAGAPKTNLPLQRTSLVGREREITLIARTLSDNRLVTVIGAGGIGKTRTAAAVGEAMLERMPGGVWLVEFAPLERNAFVTSAVARALNVRDSPSRPLLEALLAYLKQRTLLLVFDNCEHVIAEAAALADALLAGCPELRILATSREPLRVAGEQTYRLPSLRFPVREEGALLDAVGAAGYEAVILFEERARAVDRSFALRDDNAPVVAEICRRLDGIPLAIELAASRVATLGPRQMRRQLDERFRLLRSGNRDALPRQKTLRALIDWSYDLLDERERALFRRLGIFVNGFALEGAVAVGCGDDLDELDAFDVLASLIDKSLVLAEPARDALRYRMLESTRAYSVERLDAFGERELLARRHLRYFRELFAELRAREERTNVPTELDDRLELELEDVRSALGIATREPDLLARAELLASISSAWRAIGLTAEGIDWIETYRAALPPTAALLLARLSTGLSRLLEDAGYFKRALSAGSEAVAHARAADDAAVLAAALVRFSSIAPQLGRIEEAEAALAEVEALPGISAAQRLDVLASRASLSLSRGDVERAADLRDRLRAEYRRLGHSRGEQGHSVNLALVEHQRGRTQRAIFLIAEILPDIRLGRDTDILRSALTNLASFRLSVDEYAGAEAAAREVVELLAKSDPNGLHVALALESLACVYALRGEARRAATLAGYADAAQQRLGYARDFTDRATHERLVTALRENVPAAEVERLQAEGALLTSDAAVALALD